ncbi:MAG: hypothetical protein V2J25_01315 [Desulfatiglans sp.]|nr:hypothetical protein [Thermodesulfobacteriota bacterium]MEE4351485.1 hypothetical protein [Desulfatiglans sp.]
MKEYAASEGITEKACLGGNRKDQYHSAEFSIDGLEMSYQFKLWDSESTSSKCVLVKENSHILPCLREGDTLNVKYYSSGSEYTSTSLETAIKQITKNDQGRFKGHYSVDIEILEDIDYNQSQ